MARRELISTSDLAARWGISVDKVYSICKILDLEGIAIQGGGEWHYPRAEADRRYREYLDLKQVLRLDQGERLRYDSHRRGGGGWVVRRDVRGGTFLTPLRRTKGDPGWALGRTLFNRGGDRG